ncbi:YesL family protein [Glutamicibacter nicotianae]|nr:DUF624 domain-containing protein [Glutamicibacter nicotianae]
MKNFAMGYEFLARIILMVFVLNAAVVAFTLRGLVVAGFFPSVAACYASCRSWVLSEDRRWTVAQTWRTFGMAWKQERRVANLAGWPQLLIGLLLAWDYYLVNWNDMGAAGVAASGLVLLANALYWLFVLVFWAVAANFEERPWWLVRTSLQLVLARPWCSLMLASMLGLTAWAWATWPGILVAFGLATPIFLVVLCVHCFGRLPGMDAREPQRAATPAGQPA